jgi:hypothetical protein
MIATHANEVSRLIARHVQGAQAAHAASGTTRLRPSRLAR